MRHHLYSINPHQYTQCVWSCLCFDNLQEVKTKIGSCNHLSSVLMCSSCCHNNNNRWNRPQGISGDPGPGPETGNWFWSEMGGGDTHGQAEADKRREGGRALSRGHEDIRTQPLWSLRLRLNKLGSNLGKWPSLYCKHCTLLMALVLKW